MKVYTVIWDNDDGVDEQLFVSKAEAETFMDEVIDGWWASTMPPDTEKPRDRTDALDCLYAAGADLTHLSLHSYTLADAGMLPTLAEHARARLDDWESGIDDGTYDADPCPFPQLDRLRRATIEAETLLRSIGAGQ